MQIPPQRDYYDLRLFYLRQHKEMFSCFGNGVTEGDEAYLSTLNHFFS